MLSRARGHKFLTFRGTKKARQTSWRRLPCLGKEKKRQHSEVRVKIASSKPKLEDNLTKTKVNMGQQHGQVNSGSLSGVQSLPPGCELKKRNVRCQQKNTRRRIEWVDTPSKEKKKTNRRAQQPFATWYVNFFHWIVWRELWPHCFFYTSLLGNLRKDINRLTWHELAGVWIWRKCNIQRRY